MRYVVVETTDYMVLSITGTAYDPGNGFKLFQSDTANIGDCLLEEQNFITLSNKYANYVNLYYQNASSNINGYFNLIPNISSDVETISSTSSSNGTSSLLNSYITYQGSPNDQFIPSGIWTFNYYSFANSITATTNLIFNVFTRNLSGTEVKLFEITGSNITSSSSSSPFNESLTTSLTSGTNINVTDRIVSKIYFKNSSSNGITGSLLNSGTSHNSSIQTPLTRMDGISGISGTSITGTSGTSGISGKADSGTSGISGSSTSGTSGNSGVSGITGIGNVYFSSSSSYVGVANTTTEIMMGIKGAIIPKTTGNIYASAVGSFSASNQGGYRITLLYGTGTPPNNHDSQTGTTIAGSISAFSVGVGNIISAFSIAGGVTGLPINTSHWVDVSFAQAVSNSVSSIPKSVTIAIFEI